MKNLKCHHADIICKKLNTLTMKIDGTCDDCEHCNLTEEEETNYKEYQCPYAAVSCMHVDLTTGALEISCEDCDHHNHGIRLTGGLDLGLFIGLFS